MRMRRVETAVFISTLAVGVLGGFFAFKPARVGEDRAITTPATSFRTYGAEGWRAELTITGWEKAGDGVWKSYITDAQVSLVIMKLRGDTVSFEVVQDCFDEKTNRLAEKKTLRWQLGEGRGAVTECSGEKAESTMPPFLESIFLNRWLPPEVRERIPKARKMRRA